ncbi:hemolysin family protein [Promicromonospora thailandica]|uniref:hemolysin family protein n=1 Tax=Promicromonospora thailandica TaxID=765201 RepID=UPI0020A37FA8|nr:hemolysin family protein [Promicromonospora thailandica]
MIVLLLTVVVLVGLSLAGMLSAGEAALLRVTRASLTEALAEAELGQSPDPDRADRIRRAQALVVDPTAIVASFALVRVMSEVVAIAAGTLLVQQAIPGREVPDELPVMLIALVVGAVIGVIFVRVSPRALGFRRPVAVLVALVGPLTGVSRAVAWLTRLSVPRHDPSPPTEAELRDIVDRVGESTAFEESDRELLRSVIELGGTITREVMVPRTDMVTVAADTSLDRVLRLFLRSGFSRVPVIGESVDDVVGVAYLKDVVAAVHWPVGAAAPEPTRRPAGDVARDAVFVPESKPIDDLLREMQASASHIALVVDEYGGVAGLVTIEDLLEEVVGELTDEHDTVPVQEVEDLGGGTFRVPARLPVDELGDLFDLRLDDDDVDTAGGLLAKALGKVPLAGSSAEVGGVHLAAERVEGRRKQISTLLVHRTEPVGEPDDSNGGPDQQDHRDQKQDQKKEVTS